MAECSAVEVTPDSRNSCALVSGVSDGDSVGVSGSAPNAVTMMFCSEVRTAMTDAPPSLVSLGRTRTRRHSRPRSLVLLSSPGTLTRLGAEKTSASPVSSIITSSSHWSEPALTCFARWRHQAGDEKRWHMTNEARSSSVLGITVGSWVAMVTRVTRCRCWRMTLAIERVRRAASLEERTL